MASFSSIDLVLRNIKMNASSLHIDNEIYISWRTKSQDENFHLEMLLRSKLVKSAMVWQNTLHIILRRESYAVFTVVQNH